MMILCESLTATAVKRKAEATLQGQAAIFFVPSPCLNGSTVVYRSVVLQPQVPNFIAAMHDNGRMKGKYKKSKTNP